MVLSKKGEYEGCGTCGEVVHGTECEGAKHGSDYWREE